MQLTPAAILLFIAPTIISIAFFLLAILIVGAIDSVNGKPYISNLTDKFFD